MLEEDKLGTLEKGVTNAAVTWQEPRGATAPKGHHNPCKGMDGPTRLSSPIIRDREHAHPQSTSWHGLTPLWSEKSLQGSTYILACWSPSKLADTVPHGKDYP